MTQTSSHSAAGSGESPQADGPSQGPIPDDPFPIIAREGWPIIVVMALVGAGLTALLEWVGGPVAGIAALLICGPLVLWAIWFFRDPPRRTPVGRFIAPADGVVSFVGPSTPPSELGLTGPFTRVSIFMNVFNVHVNRCPADATVAAVHYRHGKFINASLDKASEDNERCALRLTLRDGSPAACVQIAGLIARRIVCRAKAGDSFRAGQRYGLIRFGSRVDVYMPGAVEPLVKLGDKTVAGETVLVAEGR